ncbi:hypothetical protein BO78DRAFT_422071 [Aspergillus sclerotiicarbonarius CBS 121057]|uniref:Uncharacterized protein n=1 Tax=Aspergillus sclerotiicarbonarius (strain CBS 121057 / IBT 28362) TaxID=1448318 RepID=A0A319DYM1_ASPSB|nr:hypothetical protein BO78DRAFT_422071 [Aspergillus sclerotiicarbonarius CBS 121057]
MKLFNFLALSFLTTLTNAAAVSLEDTTPVPKDTLDTRSNMCGQICTGKNSCYGKCNRCTAIEATFRLFIAILCEILSWYILLFGDRVIDREESELMENEVLFDDDDNFR